MSPKLSLVEFSDVMQQSQVPLKGLTFSDVLARAAEIAANSPKRQRYYSDASQAGSEAPESVKTELSTRTSVSTHLPETIMVKSEELAHCVLETVQQEVKDIDGSLEVESHAKVLEVMTSEASAGTPLKLFKSKSLEKLVGGEKEKNLDDLVVESASIADSTGQKTKSDLGMESLASVDRYTLCNNDRIES